MAEIIDISEEFMGEKFDPLTQDEVVQNLNRASQPQAEIVNDGKPLPEADFNIPKSNNNQSSNTSTQNGGGSQQKTAEPKFNQEFDNLPSDEQEEGAEQTAELVIFGYSQLKMLLPKAISVSEKQLKKKEKAGEINLSIPFRRSPNDNRPITVMQMVQEFNNSIQKPFETSEEFKAGVKPLLISIFKKKGVALSPEHLLMILVAQDVIGTGIKAARCMADRKEMLNDLKELKDLYSSQNKPNTASSTANTTQPFAPNRKEPDEPNVTVNTDNVETFVSEQENKKETAASVSEISKKMVDREEKRAKQKKEKTTKVRKQRVVIKADDSGITQN